MLKKRCCLGNAFFVYYNYDISMYTDICSLFEKNKKYNEVKSMLETKKALVYVNANRINGISKKTGRDYDFANIEVSDGIGSLEWPIVPELVPTLNLNRGDKVQLHVDVRKDSFGNTQFIVDKVTKAM